MFSLCRLGKWDLSLTISKYKYLRSGHVMACCTRNLMRKTPSGPARRFQEGFQLFRPKTLEDFEQFCPPGYKLVYVLPYRTAVNFCHVGSCLALIYVLVNLARYANDQELRMRHGTGALEPLYDYEIMALILIMSLFTLTMSTRVIRFIYRKENDFQLERYGVFGRYSRRTINQTLNECKSPTTMNPFYKVRNKDIILSMNGFLKEKDYYDMCEESRDT